MTRPENAPLLRVEGLTVDATTGRGTAHILRGVDLVVGRGRIVGVVGESGSGKSTLALALLRLLPKNVSRLSGAAMLTAPDGRSTDLVTASDATMLGLRGVRLAMIFQDPATALNPLFTVGTQLVDVLRRREPGLGRRAARARARAALGHVEIADPGRRMGAYPHELSGGMRQRVMISMALLVRPDLLLADEPTTALDATVEAGIVALLDRLRAELGTSVLFISHRLGLVAGLCDDIAVMYGGRVIEMGPAASVFAAPNHPYTAALLACEPDVAPPGPLPTIPGSMPDPHAEIEGCGFASRCGFVEARCRTETQALRGLGADRGVACWKAV